jgi:hypothetical protein
VVIEDRGLNVKGLMNINVGGYKQYEFRVNGVRFYG